MIDFLSKYNIKKINNGHLDICRKALVKFPEGKSTV